MSELTFREVSPDEVAQIKAQYKRFIDEEVIPAEPELNRHDEAAAKKLAELKSRAKEAGLWALGHPEEIGGGGLPFLAFAEMNEIIGRSHFGQMAVGSVSMQDSIMLHLYANDEQKDRWLKPLVAGEIYPSVGLTEPEVAGSDPTLMQTTARLQGDEWVINGHKWFTSGANIAAFTTVFCDGLDTRRALRDLAEGCSGSEGEPAGRAWRGLRDCAETTRTRPHLPLHALARAGAARLRVDV
jgi:alkylation response protein AidB-like acyl-CoA dehydrogenase